MSLKPHLPIDTLELTIRFSASLPDLHLSISLAEQPHANTSTLKQLIRTHLPADLSPRRIRLIYSGKALSDDAALSTSLKRSLSHPPSRTSTPRPTVHNGDADASSSRSLKGKSPIRDSTPIPTTRIYIHCSIGDLVLTPTELAAEARLAHPQDASPSSQTSTTTQTQAQNATNDPPPVPAPRGFDRLLATGFTPAEVTSLRLQFLSIQSHTHTPDDMPSPSTLRAMEDQWLDSSFSATTGTVVNSNPNADGTGTAGGGGDNLPLLPGASDEESEANSLDDMLWGTAMGFFWPVGCLWWAVREDGVWSGRRRMAVVIGAVLNLGVAFVRFTG
jgi:iron-sulfur cluster assembly 1